MNRALIFALFGLLAAQSLDAQWGRGWRRYPPRFPTTNDLSDSRFFFARVLYESVRREAGGQGWYTDYPDADRNFMQRMGELTTTGIATDEEEQPNYVVVRLAEDDIFSFPFLFMSDVGTIGITPVEARRLQEYLLKGGFLYVDDFWGTYAWEHWEREIRKVLPAGEYPIFDVQSDHVMLHMLYDIADIPQIPSIQHWRRNWGEGTSERGFDSAVPHLRAIEDGNGRIIVVMTHNTDIADGWEREGEEYEFFYRFSPEAYALAINIVLYALSH
jgi:hypothetical protein